MFEGFDGVDGVEPGFTKITDKWMERGSPGEQNDL